MTHRSCWKHRDWQLLFVEHQDSIRAAVGRVARRHRLNRDETDELTSDIFLKLVEDDYLILKKFEGRSTLQTYLTVVVHRLFLDRRIAEWGKWRPSAAARREGPIAVLFEQLVVRGRLSFDEARTALERAHGLRVDQQALEALAARLPSRVRRRAVPLEAIDKTPSPYGNPVSMCIATQQAADADRSTSALVTELRSLAPEDRRLVERRYFDGASIVSIARDTSREPAKLYRHLAHLLRVLRRRLEDRGITGAVVRQFFVDVQ